MAKVPFRAIGRVADDVQARYRDENRRLGLPRIGSIEPAAPSLAVVGGGPSVVDHLPTLRAWDGEIWAINGTWRWLRDRGIASTLYTIDPVYAVDGEAFGLDVRALLADTCHPNTTRLLLHCGAQVEMAWLGAGDGECLPGCTAAATAPTLAAERGHRHVTLFGCEGSFAAGADTHVSKDERADKPPSMRVRVGDRTFLTRPDFILQTEWLAEIARALPSFLSAASGGFLPALIETGDYDVTHVCSEIAMALREAA